MSNALRVALRRRVEKLSRPAAAPVRMAWHDGAEDDRLHGSRRWIGSRVSVDSALEEDLDTLRDRTRELYRSDSIGGMIDSDLEHVVGTGFTIQAKVSKSRGVTEQQAEAFNAEVEDIFRVWEPMADRTGKNSLWRLSRLAWRMFRCDGECIAILSDVGKAEKPVPLAVEVIDGQRLETPPERSGDPLVRMGVEFSASGEIIAYHIRKTHPYDSKQIDFKYDRVPAERVIHMFDPWFAGQSRGYPWFTRVLNRLRDAKDLDEAGLIRAQVEACFAAFVKRTAPGGNPLAAANASKSDTDGERRIQDISPGAVAYLADNQDVTFSNPTAQNAVGSLQELNHRRIALGINQPYEFLMKDWRGVSFAGGRLILNAAKKSTQSAQKLMATCFFGPIWRRFVDEAVILGLTELDPRVYVLQPWLWQRHNCTAPSWEYSINPGEEVKADLDAINGNLDTLENCIARRGGDLEERLLQRSRERKMEAELEVVPPENQVAAASAEAAAAPQEAAV